MVDVSKQFPVVPVVPIRNPGHVSHVSTCQPAWRAMQFYAASATMAVCCIMGWGKELPPCSNCHFFENAAILWCTGLPRSCAEDIWQLGKFWHEQDIHVAVFTCWKKGMFSYGVSRRSLLDLMGLVALSVILVFCWIHRTSYGNIIASQGRAG